MYFLYEPVFTYRNNNKTVSNIKFKENKTYLSRKYILIDSYIDEFTTFNFIFNPNYYYNL